MAEKYLGDNLIFIISLPRSGSTLLQRVLGGHPEVVTTSEPWIMLHPVYGRRDKGIKTEYSADWAALGVNEFLEHYTDGDEVYDDAIRAFAQTIYSNAMHKGGGTHFVDKTPRYVMIVEDLVRLFPAARFVFLKRNPLSVLASIVNTQISHDLWTLERFSEELLTGPQAMLSGIDQLGDRAITLSYEDFVADPEARLDDLCARLSISYDAGMLEYGNAGQKQGFMQDRTGIDKHSRPQNSRAESWRDMLQDEQQLNFAAHYLQALGREVVVELGYDFDAMQVAVKEARPKSAGGGHVFPWGVAIMHPDQLAGRDELAVQSYRSHRDHGALVAGVRTAGYFLRGLWRSLAYNFRSNARR